MPITLSEDFTKLIENKCKEQEEKKKTQYDYDEKLREYLIEEREREEYKKKSEPVDIRLQMKPEKVIFIGKRFTCNLYSGRYQCVIRHSSFLKGSNPSLIIKKMREVKILFGLIKYDSYEWEYKYRFSSDNFEKIIDDVIVCPVSTASYLVKHAIQTRKKKLHQKVKDIIRKRSIEHQEVIDF